MKKPKGRGTPIDLKRYKNWVKEFSAYRHQVQEDRIRSWLEHFLEKDQDIAARLLDSVDFFNHEQMGAAYRSVLQSLDGWDRESRKRRGRWRFVPYSSSAGESGDSMLHKFRHANNLASKRFNSLFIHRSDIVRERLGVDDTVVLIDDFVGSGEQACTSWDDGFGEILAEVGKVYLVVVAACSASVDRIADETNMELVPHIRLTDADNVFSGSCRAFTRDEKEALLRYCEIADSKKPKGHGECGLVVVFAHTIPNNSIPILGKSSKNWEPLFRRYD